MKTHVYCPCLILNLNVLSLLPNRLAIQLDFSHHVLSDIRVSDNTGDGLGIIYSDLYFPDSVNVVERSEFSRNLGNGVLLRQLGIHMKGEDQIQLVGLKIEIEGVFYHSMHCFVSLQIV